MRTVTAQEARENMDQLAEDARQAPVRVTGAGGRDIVVMSEELYSSLHRLLVRQLKLTMDEMGAEAARRGLTEEKLGELLADEC